MSNPAGTFYVDSPNDLHGGATVIGLVKQVATVLDRAYPGWLWAIEPDAKGGIINVRSLRISGKWAYTLHIARVQNDPACKAALIAGGELLERFGFRRCAYSYAEWRRREQVCGVFMPDVIDRARTTRKQAHTENVRAMVDAGKAVILTDPRIGAALKDAGRMVAA